VFGLRHAKCRRAPDVLARQAAMYLANVAFGLSYTEISTVFRRDRTTVAHACAIIEDLRDDPVMDRTLTALEAALTASNRACSRA
jgi:chromosomal replication initiation ATPase DnaA